MAIQEPVLIIGAGLGGLALAQGLKKARIPFKIFERDQKDNSRAQGYRIRLHGEGLIGLCSILPHDIWTLFEQTCPTTKLGAGVSVDAVTGECSPFQPGGPGGPGGPGRLGGPGGASNAGGPRGPMSVQNGQMPFTVDRGVMREVLLTGLEGNITFGKTFKRFDLLESGVKAEFSDGSTESGSLLVGADGVCSAVRRQYLPETKILDLGGQLIYGKTPLTPEVERKLMAQTMESMSAVRDHTLGTITLIEAIRFPSESQRPENPILPDDYIYWVMALPGTNSPVKETELKGLSNQRSADLANRLTAHWHPLLEPLFEYQDPDQTGVFRLLSSPSTIQPWLPDPRVTLLGDAAHAMIPAAASGAVTAMRDAALLTNLICESGNTRESIGEYESIMRGYAEETVTFSAKVGQMVFGQKSLQDCAAADL